MSDAARRSSGVRDALVIALAIAFSIGLVALIWFAIERYEGNPVFEGILALLAVGVNVYMLVVCVRLLWLRFRRRQ